MKRLFQIAFSLIVAFIVLMAMGFAPVVNNKGHVKAKVSGSSDSIFPAPPSTDKLLFYVQRTPNVNTIVYELNTDKDGTPHKHEPVHAYWIIYTDGGRKSELTYFQRKFAYGIHHTLTDAEKHSYKLNFVSYGKKDIYLQRSIKDKKYHAYMQVGNKNIELSRIFLRIEGGTFWFPNVPYVEISGRDAATGHFVKERFKP